MLRLCQVDVVGVVGDLESSVIRFPLSIFLFSTVFYFLVFVLYVIVLVLHFSIFLSCLTHLGCLIASAEARRILQFRFAKASSTEPGRSQHATRTPIRVSSSLPVPYVPSWRFFPSPFSDPFSRNFDYH